MSRAKFGVKESTGGVRGGTGYHHPLGGQRRCRGLTRGSTVTSTEDKWSSISTYPTDYTMNDGVCGVRPPAWDPADYDANGRGVGRGRVGRMARVMRGLEDVLEGTRDVSRVVVSRLVV